MQLPAGGEVMVGRGVGWGPLLKLLCCMACWMLDRAWFLSSKSQNGVYNFTQVCTKQGI